MSYVDDHLMPGERVVYRARQHWIIFGWSILLLTAAVAWLIVCGQVREVERFWPVAIVPAALGLILGLAPLIKYLTSEYAITDKRVLIKVGLVQRRSLEALLSKVEAIGVEQGLMDRVIGRGTITITGTGGTREMFDNIADPLEFRKQVQSQVVGLTTPDAAVPAAGARVEPRVERECPYCAERILARARLCKHCGREVLPIPDSRM